MAATVTVNITGDANSLRTALGQAQSSLDSFQAKAQSIGSTATSIGRSMTFGLTLPIVAAFKVANDELTQSAAASAQTEAAIRSTGGAANVTAAQIDQMSTSLLKKTGIDDEVIKGGANVLLTFRAIKNEAGANNDIFNQATTAALDLSVAFGKDMTSSAILVGKALQDPIGGLTALRRVGVQFSDSQVELIKNLVAAGDTMGAQKVILKELQTEVGGSADAYGKSFAGSVSRAQEEFKNAMAAILASAAPVMEQIASWALKAAQAFEGLPDPVKKVVVVVAALVAVAGPLVYIFGAVAKAISGAIAVIQFMGSMGQTAALKLLYLRDAIREVGVAESLLGTTAGLAIFTAGVAAAGLAIDHYIGDNDSFGTFLGKIREGTDAGKRWGETIASGAQASAAPLEELRARLETLRAGQEAVNRQYDAGKLSIEEAAGAHARYEGAITTVKGAIEDEKQKQQTLEAQNRATNKSINDLTSGTTDWANATDEAKNAILELQSAVLAQTGGMLGLQQANLNLTKAQNDYNTALASGDPAKITEAELNLQQARLGVAQATTNAYDQNQKLLDLVRQGPGAVQEEINRLRDMQTTLGDSSGAIQEQIDKLLYMNLVINGSPTYHSTHFEATGLDTLGSAIEGVKNSINSLPGEVHIRVIAEKAGDAWSFLSSV